MVSLFLAFNMFFDYPHLFENPTCSTAFCFLEDHVQQHYFNVVVEKCKFILILHTHILKVMRMILVSLSSAYFNLFFFHLYLNIYLYVYVGGFNVVHVDTNLKKNTVFFCK